MGNRVPLRRRPGAHVALCLLAATAVAGAALAAEPVADIVARLGTTDFGAADLRDFVRSLDANARKQALADPQAMDRLVRLELARIATLREAKAKKWEQRPEIAAQIERAREATIVNTYLASVATPPGEFPSEAEIQSAYDLNRDKFMLPRQYRLGQIFIAVPAGADKKADDAAQKKAENLSRQAKAKAANFEEIARANSEDKDSAGRGGDMGWIPESQIVPDVRSQIVGMSGGEVSGPIRVATGWLVIRMIDTKPAAARPLAEVREALIGLLRQRRTQENEQTYLNGLLAKSPVAVNEIGRASCRERV